MQFLVDGACTKPFHAGHAAAGGLAAARLASAGYTGPASAIDGRHGFLHAFGGRDSAQPAAAPPAGQGVRGTSIKMYSCCRYIHGNLDLLLDLVHEEELSSRATSRP
jgi:2-methylcitrate dehydratase PrpD